MRTRAKIDANQNEIVDALRAVGCSVQSLAGVGKGVPDTLVYSPFRRCLLLFELKDGNKPPSRRQRTPAQLTWHAEWKGPVYVINSIAEALAEAGMRNLN
jgi:hypothetical protein